MIRVTLAQEPERFHDQVRIPGLRALAEMVGELPDRPAGRRHKKRADHREEIPPAEFPDYWTKVLDDLRELYNHTCAYSCFRIHRVTGAGSVDHFAAKSRRWDRVYEWDNYRLACSRLNARKKDFGDILDPFEILDDWFQLELVGFQVIPSPALDLPTQSRVRNTVLRLGLDGFREARAQDAEAYWARKISLNRLTQESPFVARELLRHGRLNPTDV